MKRNLRNLGVALVVASVGTLGLTIPAQAAVPSCVSTSTWSSGVWRWARASNGCSNSQRFYFRWDRAVDGDCNTLDPGWYRDEGRLYQARFAGLTSC